MADSRLYPIGTGASKSRQIGNTFVEFGVLKTQRFRVLVAQVNAGFVLLPALPGVKWRITDAAMISVGGAAGGGTSVDLLGTKAGSASRPLVIAVAALGQSVLTRAGVSNAVILADGASFTAHDTNTSISVTKQNAGSAITGSVSIDVILSYIADQS